MISKTVFLKKVFARKTPKTPRVYQGLRRRYWETQNPGRGRKWWLAIRFHLTYYWETQNPGRGRKSVIFRTIKALTDHWETQNPGRGRKFYRSGSKQIRYYWETQNPGRGRKFGVASLYIRAFYWETQNPGRGRKFTPNFLWNLFPALRNTEPRKGTEMWFSACL